jgi:alpha/beta superfamily hydrolase
MRRVRAERQTIAGPSGALEVLREEPVEGKPPERFAVVCHPHPLYGGTLDNKVVHTLARATLELGIPALRFNFRGVGASAGHFDEGRGEVDDALAVREWGRELWPQAVPWLLGFSFGAVVAIRAAARANPERVVAVAPAVDRFAVDDAVPRCPWLIVQGDADEVVDPHKVLSWAARLTPAPTVAVLAGASHFFHGRLPELREAVIAFARESAS